MLWHLILLTFTVKFMYAACSQLRKNRGRWPQGIVLGGRGPVPHDWSASQRPPY